MNIRRTMILIGLLLLACYAYVLPRWSDWSQNSRLDLVLALADNGTVTIDRYVANTGDYARYDGHAYSDKAPGPVFMSLPVYMALRPLLDLPLLRQRSQALGQDTTLATTLRPEGSGLRGDKVRFAIVQYTLTLVTVALQAALLGMIFYAALLRLGLATTPALLCTLAYGLGTAAAPYAGNFYSHQLVAALLFGAWMVVFTKSHITESAKAWWDWSALLCGLLLGWAFISEYPAALPGLMIALYALYRHGWRWGIALVLGGFVPLMLLASYDLAAFGTVWPVGYLHSELWQSQHHTGFLSITYPHIAGLWGLTFGSFRGMFVRAPWLLLALPGFVAWWRTGRFRAEWWVILVTSVSLYLFYSSSLMWWGGFAAGPRYLVPLLPFLAVPAAWWIGQRWQRPVERALAIALIAVSIGATWAETLAGQLFPTDAVTATWSGYVWPAWANGDIARNLGMAIGLRGAASLLPLIIVIGMLTALLMAGGNQQQAATRHTTTLGNTGEVDAHG